jgi:hypothetical protein
LIVPDVHGRKFWEPALEYSGEIIFLGDYTDPYPEEGITQEDALQGMLRIVDFKRQNPDRVTLLVGNHELHYYDVKYRGGRFSREYYEKYRAILTDEETAGFFQLCKKVDNYLFIHAGVTKGWYDEHKDELLQCGDDLETQLNVLFQKNKYIFYEISGERGGFDKFGSPVWAHIYEHVDEEVPFDPDIIQYVGHTQLIVDEPMIRKNVRLVDNRRLYLLKDYDQLTHYI